MVREGGILAQEDRVATDLPVRAAENRVSRDRSVGHEHDVSVRKISCGKDPNPCENDEYDERGRAAKVRPVRRKRFTLPGNGQRPPPQPSRDKPSFGGGINSFFHDHTSEWEETRT